MKQMGTDKKIVRSIVRFLFDIVLALLVTSLALYVWILSVVQTSERLDVSQGASQVVITERNN